MGYQPQNTTVWADIEPQRDLDADLCKAIWAEVLAVAVDDARGAPKRASAKDVDRLIERAREWFESDRRDVGSFAWVCSVLDLDADRVRRAVFAAPRGGRVAH